MKILLLFLSFFFLTSCNKPKTVLICGDHICINKIEAQQYFEENLSIEVKIIDKKEKKELDLVELNLSENNKGKKKISLTAKKNTNKNLKILSNDEIKNIKKNIRVKKKEKSIVEKKSKKKKLRKLSLNEVKKDKQNRKISKKNVNKNRKDVADVCTILEKCSIEEISKYLLEEGKRKGFPDITRRQ